MQEGGYQAQDFPFDVERDIQFQQLAVHINPQLPMCKIDVEMQHVMHVKIMSQR